MFLCVRCVFFLVVRILIDVLFLEFFRCDDNTYTLRFLLSTMEKNQREQETAPMEIDAVNMDLVGL